MSLALWRRIDAYSKAALKALGEENYLAVIEGVNEVLQDLGKMKPQESSINKKSLVTEFRTLANLLNAFSAAIEDEDHDLLKTLSGKYYGKLEGALNQAATLIAIKVKSREGIAGFADRVEAAQTEAKQSASNGRIASYKDFKDAFKEAVKFFDAASADADEDTKQEVKAQERRAVSDIHDEEKIKEFTQYNAFAKALVKEALKVEDEGGSTLITSLPVAVHINGIIPDVKLAKIPHTVISPTYIFLHQIVLGVSDSATKQDYAVFEDELRKAEQSGLIDVAAAASLRTKPPSLRLKGLPWSFKWLMPKKLYQSVGPFQVKDIGFPFELTS